MAEEGHKVSLNVYDLSQGLARQLSMTFLGKAIEGIWHTGVVVYGNEYYFGAGVQHDPAGTTPYGTPIRTVDLGVTHIPKDVFQEYLQEISPRYTAETYSLLTHNCNNFSNEVALFLVGATIPEYILNLPKDVMGSPMGPLILPMIQNLETTLKSGAVPGASRFNPVTQLRTRNPTSTVNKNLPNGCEVNPKKAEEQCGKDVEQKSKGNVAPAVKSTANGVAGDPLGDSRNKVQEEISAEFASLMASGTLKASEAAAMASRKVMQRYGHIDVAQS